MVTGFKKIGLAIAFSPRITALLVEAWRMKNLWNAELVLIHVGEHGEKEEKLLHQHFAVAGINAAEVQVFWEHGRPAERILATCKNEGVDLLIAGALKKEKLVQYYLGTVARHILRKADCSVLMLTTPQIEPVPFKNIVVNAEDSPYVEDAVAIACSIGMQDKATWLHIVREIKLYGLTMSAAEQCSEQEYEALKQSLVRDEIQNVEKILAAVPHQGLKINIKMVSGKSGFELSKFSQRKHADLLVVGAPPRRFSFLDRVFTHDQEYLFADLPCNLLIVNPRKKDGKKGGWFWRS
jgi:nucleotide-binding universal stress UspA family protein